jgi:hypothetical protein
MNIGGGKEYELLVLGMACSNRRHEDDLGFQRSVRSAEFWCLVQKCRLKEQREVP